MMLLYRRLLLRPLFTLPVLAAAAPAGPDPDRHPRPVSALPTRNTVEQGTVRTELQKGGPKNPEVQL